MIRRKGFVSCYQSILRNIELTDNERQEKECNKIIGSKGDSALIQAVTSGRKEETFL